MAQEVSNQLSNPRLSELMKVRADLTVFSSSMRGQGPGFLRLVTESRHLMKKFWWFWQSAGLLSAAIETGEKNTSPVPLAHKAFPPGSGPSLTFSPFLPLAAHPNSQCYRFLLRPCLATRCSLGLKACPHSCPMAGSFLNGKHQLFREAFPAPPIKTAY